MKTISKIIAREMVSEVFQIKKCSCVNIGFVTNDGKEDETQLIVKHSLLTKAGEAELSELFDSLTDELNTKSDNVTYITIVASADTADELERMGL